MKQSNEVLNFYIKELNTRTQCNWNFNFESQKFECPHKIAIRYIRIPKILEKGIRYVEGLLDEYYAKEYISLEYAHHYVANKLKEKEKEKNETNISRL